MRAEFDLIQTAFDDVSDTLDIGQASGTSTTSLTVGTGSKSLTIETGRAFFTGQSISIAYTTTPTIRMVGVVASYNSTTGALVCTISSTDGSGTYAAWTVSLSPLQGATLGANTYTGAQNFATGASIAGATTINLETATGNRTHITGAGWNCTAVTLTRGPRTVIFDGIGTLTHHATTNNLPGAANITTAAGDRAIYEGDGTNVYMVAYIRAAAQSVITMTTGNGHGAVNTKIRRYTTTEESIGTAIVGADSANNGQSFTIAEDGDYEIYMLDQRAAGACVYGFSVNSAELTTSITGITAANRKGVAYSSGAAVYIPLTRTIRLSVGDVVRPHTDGTCDSAAVLSSVFSIRKVSAV